MECYDIFKSEGGYRVCGAVWGNDPVIDKSPWFATEKQAKAVAENMRIRDLKKLYNVEYCEGTWFAQYGFFTCERDIYSDKAAAYAKVIAVMKRAGYDDTIIKKVLA